MAAPKKYSDEPRDRANKMGWEARLDPATATGAIKRIADQLGIHPESLRKWVRQAEIDVGARPGTTSTEAQQLAELERENRELRRANEVLRTTSALFAAAELDRRTEVIAANIDGHGAGRRVPATFLPPLPG